MQGKLTQMRRYKTVLGGIALLGAAVPEAAHGARLVRCEVTLERSVGSVAVPGWGPDEEVARQRARDVAWLLAWADRLPMAMMGAVADPETTRLRDAALRKQLDPKTDWRVPGYAVREGSCATEALAAPKGEAWVARWERSDRDVLRNDPSVAIEGARRRQCFGAWSHRMIKAAAAASDASEERFAAGFAIARASTDGLFRCMTRVEPVLEPAGVPLEGVDAPGPVECARPRRVGTIWSAAPAWGADIEAAREAALRLDTELALVEMQRSLKVAEALPGGAAARAETLAGQAMGMLGGLVVGTDLAEQALLSCEFDAPRETRPVWESKYCEGWPTGAWTPVPAQPAHLEGAVAARCGAAFRDEAMKDWNRAQLCWTECRKGLQTTGWDGRMLWRPSEPARADAEAATQLLSEALTAKDFHLFGIATGGFVFEANAAAAFKANPAAFWASIEQARDSGAWADTAEWVQVDGAWVLSFKRRQ